ncbi:MAG: hypothetical protein KDB82_14500 [Planctomycetes bacterium]|nr:hypothetical protein [Planctomycetota bacterium]
MKKLALAVVVIAFGALMVAGCPAANNAKPAGGNTATGNTAAGNAAAGNEAAK